MFAILLQSSYRVGKCHKRSRTVKSLSLLSRVKNLGPIPWIEESGVVREIIILEHVRKPAFEPRNGIFVTRHELEDEEYRDISSPKRYVVVENYILQSRNGVFGYALR